MVTKRKRQYRGGYGHNPSGKLYTYEGEEGLRVGQRVVVPYTHWKSGEEHLTMFTITHTNAADNVYAMQERMRLLGRGIRLKQIHGTNVIADLPGGKKYLDDPRLKSLQAMKAAWTRESNERLQREIASRLGNKKTPRETDKLIRRLQNKNNLVEINLRSSEQVILSKLPKTEQRQFLRQYINDNLRGEYQYGQITSTTAGKISNNAPLDKLRASVKLNELLRNSILTQTVADTKDRNVTWEYRDVHFKILGKVYKAQLNIKISRDSKVLYDIKPYDKIT